MLFYCLTPDGFTCTGRPSGWERVKWAYLSISLPSPFPSQTGQKLVPLLFYCLMPHDFTRQRRASAWERVKSAAKLSLSYIHKYMYKMSRDLIDIDVHLYLRLHTEQRTWGSHNYKYTVNLIRPPRMFIFILFLQEQLDSGITSLQTLLM